MGQSRKITALIVAPAFAAAMTVAACETKEQQGTVAGAVVGGAVGSLFGSGKGRVLAIAGGAIVGGFIGNRVGKNMDDKDRREAQAAAKKAETAPVGEEIAWSNPDSGNNGTIEVTREGMDADGNNCREFKHTVTAGGETETATGVACKRPDGKWVTVQQDE